MIRARQSLSSDLSWVAESRAVMRRLSGLHRQSVVDYAGDGHLRINRVLRGRKRVRDPWVESRVRALDAVLGMLPLTSGMRLTRVVSLRGAFQLADGAQLDKVAGLQRVEAGFLSTSRRGEFAMKRIADPLVLEVLAPSGCPAAAVEDISPYPHQFEVLLGRGRPYVILSPEYDRRVGIWRARMRILPE